MTTPADAASVDAHRAAHVDQPAGIADATSARHDIGPARDEGPGESPDGGSDTPGDAGAQLSLDSGDGRRLLATTVLGSGMVFLDGTITNVALPQIGRELHADLGGLQWVVNGYALSLAALIIVGGSLGDRFGRKRVYAFGVAAFVVASIGVALAPTTVTLVLARIVQGVAAAALTPGSLAMLQASFTQEHRLRAIGAWSGMLGIATAAGPVVGGWLVGIDWRYGFWLNVPLGLLVLWLLRTAPESRDPHASRHLDVPALVLTVVMLTGLTWSLTDTHVARSVVAGVVAVVAAVVLVIVERRARRPMIPPALFASRVFTWVNVATLFVYAALTGSMFMLALHLQVSAGWSPLAAGASTLPISGIMLVLSSRFGEVATRRGPMVPMAAGMALAAVGFALLSRAGAHPDYVRDVLPGVCVQGLGMSMFVSPLTGTVLAAAPAGSSGLASGLNNAVSRTAGLVAVALLPALVGLSGDAYRHSAQVAHAYAASMRWCVGGVLLGLVATIVAFHDEPRRPASG